MPQLFYDSQVFGDLYSNEDDKDVKVMRDGVLTNSTKYACEYFYYLLEKEEFNFELQVLCALKIYLPFPKAECDQ